jgi:hypothetical protein
MNDEQTHDDEQVTVGVIEAAVTQRRKIAPSFHALARFVRQLETMPKRERDAMIRWLVTRYEVPVP